MVSSKTLSFASLTRHIMSKELLCYNLWTEIDSAFHLYIHEKMSLIVIMQDGIKIPIGMDIFEILFQIPFKKMWGMLRMDNIHAYRPNCHICLTRSFWLSKE